MSSTKITLYDAEKIGELPEGTDREELSARRYLKGLIREGVENYFANLNSEIFALEIDDIILPLTVNNTEYDNCYVCSPYDLYVTYPRDSLSRVESGVMKYGCQLLLSGFERVLRRGEINRCVSVNNWLFATNLYPDLSPQQIASLTELLRERFPCHAICLRSISQALNPKLFDALIKSGYCPVFYRQMFLFNPFEVKTFRSRMFKSDMKILKESPHEICPVEKLSEAELSQIVRLYTLLNIEKHSALNPLPTAHFFARAIDSGFLKMKVWRDRGDIDAVLGYYQRGNAIAAPIFGYDTSLLNSNLYRQLSTVLTLEAKERGQWLHASSGASTFKSLRRASRHHEYMLVNYRHLPFKQRLPWETLKAATNSLGKKLVKKFDF